MIKGAVYVLDKEYVEAHPNQPTIIGWDEFRLEERYLAMKKTFTVEKTRNERAHSTTYYYYTWILSSIGEKKTYWEMSEEELFCELDAQYKLK